MIAAIKEKAENIPSQRVDYGYQSLFLKESHRLSSTCLINKEKFYGLLRTNTVTCDVGNFIIFFVHNSSVDVF